MRHPEFYYGCAEEARIIAKAAIDPEARKPWSNAQPNTKALPNLRPPKKVKNLPIRSSSENLSASHDKCRKRGLFFEQ